MTQRLLVKLDVLKKYTMKRLAKYEKVESQSLGKVHLSPFVKIPLTVELKLDYESPRKSRFFASTECESSRHQKRPKSVSAAQTTRKKPALRPGSAPNSLKPKPSDQKGKLQTLDGGFIILKLNQKLKPLHFTTEVQKRPERISDEESKTLGHTDTSHHRLSAAAARQDGQTAIMGKGDKTEPSNIQISSEDAQSLEKDSKVTFHINGDWLPYDPNTRKETLSEDILMTGGEEIKKDTVDSKDDALKEKKSFIPLSIEDEIERPNAKIIRVDLPKTKPPTPMKMSETRPVLCNNERYLQKLILDKYVDQYEGKASHDTHVVFTHVNPILENNYNETLAILRSQNFASRVTAKKKRKPILFSRSQILCADILSREKKCCTPMHSQIGKPIRQKRPGSFTHANIPITKEAVKERNVLQTIHKGKQDEFIVSGVNLKVDICHGIVSTSGISGTKSQILDSLDKPVIPAEEVSKKRVIYVDYIPISKPVKMYTTYDELTCHNSSLSINNFSAINYGTEGKLIQRDQPDVNQDASDKKAFLDKTSLDNNMEFSEYHHPFSFEEDSDISSTTMSTLSSRCFQAELNASFKSQEEKEEPIVFSHSQIISIPTAQYDASESNKDLSMQRTTGH